MIVFYAVDIARAVAIVLVAALFFLPLALALFHGSRINPTRRDCKDLNPVNRHVDKALRSAPELGRGGVWITEFYSATLHALFPLGLLAALAISPFFFRWSPAVRTRCCVAAFGAAALCYVYYGFIGFKRYRRQKRK
jgi:hypothetical protein